MFGSRTSFQRGKSRKNFGSGKMLSMASSDPCVLGGFPSSQGSLDARPKPHNERRRGFCPSCYIQGYCRTFVLLLSDKTSRLPVDCGFCLSMTTYCGIIISECVSLVAKMSEFCREELRFL